MHKKAIVIGAAMMSADSITNANNKQHASTSDTVLSNKNHNNKSM